MGEFRKRKEITGAVGFARHRFDSCVPLSQAEIKLVDGKLVDR